jgi:hypothetical protein
MRKIMFAAFLICFTQTYAETPIPEALLNAKTAFVRNDGAEAKDFDKFCTLLKEWGRFELVQDRGKADIGIALSAQLQYRTVQVPSTSGGIGSVASQQVITSYIRIFNARDDTKLWSDQIDSKDPKSLVQRLKNKMKKK